MSQQEQTQNDGTINRVTTPATIESAHSTKSTSPSQSMNQSITTPLNPDQLPTSPISISSPSSSPVSTSVSSSITTSPTPFNPLPTRSINFAALNSKTRQQSSPNSHPNSRVNTQSPSSQAQSQACTPSTISPVPSAGPSRSQSPVVPPLHDLVNDCFLLTIDKLQDETRTYIANSFHQCVAKQHCEENLEFLIDIYRYEYEYNLKVLASSLSHAATNNIINSPPPSLSTSLNSKAVLNGFNHNEATSMAKMKLNAPSPCIVPTSHATSTTSLAKRHQKTSSVASFESLRKKQSIASEDLDPQEVFVSTIDDLDLNAPWGSFGDQHVGEDEEYTDDEEDDDEGDQSDPQRPEDYLTKEDLHELNERWIFIMDNYIKHDSPSQINISQKLFKEVVEESSVCKLHDPIILLKARNEVLQILKENCYGSFASKFKKQCSRSCDQEGCCPCSVEDKKNGTVGPNNNSMLTLEGTETNITSCTECREIPSMSTTSTTTVSSSMRGDTDKQQQQKQKHNHHHHHHFHHHHHHAPRSPDSPSLSSSSSIAASLLGKLSLPKRNRSTTRSHQQQNGNFTSPLYGEMSSPSSNSSSTSNIFGQAKFTNNGDVSPSPSSVSSSLRGIPISSSSRKYQPSSQLQQGSSNNSSGGSAYAPNSLPIPRSSNTSPISMNSVTSSAAQQDRDREVNSSGSLLSGGASLGSSLKFWKKKP